MRGEGGRAYWGSRNGAEGVVVVFAWLSSQERNIRPYIELYASLGWRCLVCHSNFLTLFSPEKATSLACSVLTELVKEVKIRPFPIVFASFSGGSKGCLYKVLQDGYQLVRECVCGQIVVSWMAKAIASGLDALFINRFEAQRAEYWLTLYSSSCLGPFLIFCSKDDELASYRIVCDFAQHLLEHGADVKVVTWSSSPHVAHYKHYQVDYRAAVTELLSKSAVNFSRTRQLNTEATGRGYSSDEILGSVCCLHKATVGSNESLKRVAIGPSDHFLLPSSLGYHETRCGLCTGGAKGWFVRSSESAWH